MTESAHVEIRLLHLTKRFADSSGRTFSTAVDDVTFDVHENEFFCILGASGCGKSTLLNLIAGFTDPSEGELLVHGKPIAGPGPDRAVVFQEYGLFPWKTLRENIEFGLKAKGLPASERRRISQQYVDLVHLSGHADKFPYQVSGGMKQRCSVARALAPDPEIILMDEPFGALDAQTRDRLQEEILDIWERAKRKTIVFITHSIDEAIFLADRVLIMTPHPGRVKEIVHVELPRPRRRELRESTAFLDLRNRISVSLRHQDEPADVLTALR